MVMPYEQNIWSVLPLVFENVYVYHALSVNLFKQASFEEEEEKMTQHWTRENVELISS